MFSCATVTLGVHMSKEGSFYFPHIPTSLALHHDKFIQVIESTLHLAVLPPLPRHPLPQ